ncbi:unnamed protein product [Vitrella brassicaformis CCMP3155]|uniref:Orotidine 5'-phosphate decarboxylase n=1 Tax=Vitrella brassicaformis (strain CCMP3155) TaxID=1169540 RepID=A0A0G4FCH3_VITBC|nr:unnamed protein product [Vitrella brassicaformis CCMP3155]|eukprot:CEM10929.1 unnamed protein product [Vitrella brassicaformis CCMP3155]
MSDSTAFFPRLCARIRAVDSILCIGLDPHTSLLNKTTSADSSSLPTAADVEAFCDGLIDATLAVACCYKPNVAFFEALGGPGLELLAKLIAKIPKDIPVLLDCKRGDIGSTAAAYATASYHHLKADAVTLSPYMGTDSIVPFIEDGSKAAFVVCKSSNPGSNDLQALAMSDGRPLYLHVARLCERLGRTHDNNVGLVVGATDCEALRRVRSECPDVWILAPGIGAQGGDLKEALTAGLRPDGLGMIMPVSRAISRAEDMRGAAEELRQQMNAVRREVVHGGRMG